MANIKSKSDDGIKSETSKLFDTKESDNNSSAV